MTDLLVPPLYIPSPPGIHYVGPNVPASPTMSYPTPYTQSYYSYHPTVVTNIQSPGVYGYPPPAYYTPIQQPSWQQTRPMMAQPNAPMPMTDQMSNHPFPQPPPPTPENKSQEADPTSLEALTQNPFRYGLHAFAKGINMAFFPALFAGLLTFQSKSALGYSKAFGYAGALTGLITLMGGAFNTLWTFKNSIKKKLQL